MSSKGCSVCKDPEGKDNPILKCEQCELEVHVLCYGIQNVEKFVCSPCIAKAGVVRCALCEKPGGAMKKTTDDRWAHVLCTFFTADSRFVDTSTMEPIDITKIKQPRKKLPCVFCNETCGTFKCSQKQCLNAIHATCGLEKNSLVEEVKADDTIVFQGYCDVHAKDPNDKKKRLSSDRLTAAIRQKTNKQNISQANKENSDWILKAATESQNKVIQSPAIHASEIDVANEERDLSGGCVMNDSNATNQNDNSGRDVSKDIDVTQKVEIICTPDIPGHTSDVKENDAAMNDECHKDILIKKLRFENSNLKIELEALKVLNSELHKQIKEKLKSASVKMPSTQSEKAQTDQTSETNQKESTEKGTQMDKASDASADVVPIVSQAQKNQEADTSVQVKPTEMNQNVSTLVETKAQLNENSAVEIVTEQQAANPAKNQSQSTQLTAQSEQNAHFVPKEENGYMVYGDCIRISKKDDLALKKLPITECNDAKFANLSFEAMLQSTPWGTLFRDEEHDKKKVKEKFQSTKEYAILKSIYENRVVSDKQNVAKRMKQFNTHIKKKIDNKIDYMKKKQKKAVSAPAEETPTETIPTETTSEEAKDKPEETTSTDDGTKGESAQAGQMKEGIDAVTVEATLNQTHN